MPRVGPDGQISKAARKAAATVAAKPKKPKTLSEQQRKALRMLRECKAELTSDCVDDMFVCLRKLAVDVDMENEMEKVAAMVGEMLTAKLRKCPKVSGWPQHVKEFMANTNLGVDQGTRAHLIDLTEEERKEMSSMYEALTEEELIALVARAQSDRDTKDVAVASGSTTGCKLGSGMAEGVVTNSWDNVLAVLNSLVFMNGSEVFFLFACGGNESMFNSRSFATPKAKTFFHHITGATPDEIALSLESFTISGICKLFKLKDKSDRSNETSSERLRREKQEVGDKITAMWVTIMREHKLYTLNTRPMWKRYEIKMVREHGIALDNWPLNKTPGDWIMLTKDRGC
ncbi:unnamed protein product [Peniophora sp. CBMAI 1063]|nr:unnamed protein product [Peniophora sp. CBMAI 1063]